MEPFPPFQSCERFFFPFFFLHSSLHPHSSSSNLLPRTLASKNIKLTRPSLVNSIATTAELDYYGTELFRLIRDEKFQIKIHEIYPLKDVARAHAVSFMLLSYLLSCALIFFPSPLTFPPSSEDCSSALFPSLAA